MNQLCHRRTSPFLGVMNLLRHRKPLVRVSLHGILVSSSLRISPASNPLVRVSLQETVFVVTMNQLSSSKAPGKVHRLRRHESALSSWETPGKGKLPRKSLFFISRNQLCRQKPPVRVRSPVLWLCMLKPKVHRLHRRYESALSLSKTPGKGEPPWKCLRRHESALSSVTPGKGKISHVIALHVKTESTRISQENSSAIGQIIAGGIIYRGQDYILSNQSDIAGSHLGYHEISKSAIGNRQSESGNCLRHLARFSLHNDVFLYVLHKKHQDIGVDIWGLGVMQMKSAEELYFDEELDVQMRAVLIWMKM